MISRPGLFYRRIGEAEPGIPDQLLVELAEYLRGSREEFTLKPEYPKGGFAGKVLDIVRGIPYGETLTYGEVAARAGRPGAARAVGAVLRSNPVPLLVPCHRVVGKNWIGGYGLGVDVKVLLLKIEGALPTPSRRPRRRARTF